MRIRLQDVAGRAGVSEATVSRVINAKGGVSQRTRTKVLAVLAELGYEPAALAPPGRVGLVGLVVPELDNPVFPAYAQAIESQLLASGYVAVLCCAGRAAASEEDYIAVLSERGVKGIIVVSGRHADIGGDHSHYEDLHRRHVPLVFVNGRVDGLAVPSVSSDDEYAAAAAVRHLAHLGHERIGLLVGPVCYRPVLDKIDGYRDAVAELGLARDDGLIAESMFTVEGGHAGAEQLLAAGATGIVAASDLMALGAIQAAREIDLAVPFDVSVVGYDDTDLMAFTDPPLTTMRQPVLAISDHATRLLIAQITGAPFSIRDYRVRPELIARGSTASRSVVRVAG